MSGKVAIMQPYFLPYIGYFQLIRSVDLFIVYDNIKYTKKGWITRNRILSGGQENLISLPLKKASDSLTIGARELASDFTRDKLLNQIRGAYQKAPHFSEVFPLLETIVGCDESNLFQYLLHSISCMCKYLGVQTEIRVSSEIPIDHSLKNQDKVLALCKAVQAKTYVNAIGGMELYSRDAFRAENIELKFIRSRPYEYPQSHAPFVPWLSILDVIMFDSLDRVQDCIESNYELI